MDSSGQRVLTELAALLFQVIRNIFGSVCCNLVSNPIRAYAAIPVAFAAYLPAWRDQALAVIHVFDYLPALTLEFPLYHVDAPNVAPQVVSIRFAPDVGSSRGSHRSSASD